MERTSAWACAVRTLAGSARHRAGRPSRCPSECADAPACMTPDVPVLVLTRVSSTYDDGGFCLDLDFRPGPGTHDETRLGFYGWPLADPDGFDSTAEEARSESGELSRALPLLFDRDMPNSPRPEVSSKATPSDLHISAGPLYFAAPGPDADG